MRPPSRLQPVSVRCAERPLIRVSHVITGLGVGGAEMMLAKLVAAMDRNRFTTQVIALSDELALADRIRASGAEVTSLGLRPGLRGNAGALRRMTDALRRSRPDVVQTWLYHADLLGGLAGKRLGVPVIWNIRASTLEAGISRRTRMIARLCALISPIVPSAVVSCSRAGMETHVGMGYSRRRFHVIANGIDVRRFGPDAAVRTHVRAELGVSDDLPLIGMVARLHPQKDHPTFFAAAARLLQTHPRARFVLAGPGVDRNNDDVATMIRAAGVADQTILLGVRSDIERLLCGLDIHTLSSAYAEGFPNVVGEAMAAGVPCVVTDVGDSSYIVGDTGRTVAVRDPDALAAAWREILSLPAGELDTLRRRARERVATQFSLETSVAKYEELYERTSARQ